MSPELDPSAVGIGRHEDPVAVVAAPGQPAPMTVLVHVGDV
jgi:hypothetical protein